MTKRERSLRFADPVTRRTFLGRGLSAFGFAVAPFPSRPQQPVTGSSYPFSLGVASGDPLPGGVVLWTRLAPEPLRGGGMPPAPVEVEWRVAADEQLSRVVHRGTAVATAEFAHSVHVEVNGLEPATWYWYQFRVGSEVSPIGRTRTAPPLGGSVDRVNLAFVSCQRYEAGYYAAFRHMTEEDLDVVIHLGDYIYDGPGRDGPRRHTGGATATLSDYRNRYALYKGDRDLQAAHAAFPWIVTWDDHEVANDYAALTRASRFGGRRGGARRPRRETAVDFPARRRNAYQAYYEHMPLRRSSMPHGPDMLMYRRVSMGALAEFFVLDTRQYRTVQPCGGRYKALCDGVFDPNATLMGREQERWLFDGLEGSRARWNVIPQQILVADVDFGPGGEELYMMDKWSGYADARRRLLEYFQTRRPSNPVVLTGDIHSSWVNDLKVDFREMTSETVATEFVGTSISSGGDGSDNEGRPASPPVTERVLAENPFVRFFNNRRGYVRCRVTPELWTADYRIVQYVSRPGSPVSTLASFVVENGRPGAMRA